MPASGRKLSRRGLLIISLALIAGLLLAWRSRGLSESERRLIGAWRFDVEDTYWEFHFAENRRYSELWATIPASGDQGSGMIKSGSWKVRGDRLILMGDRIRLSGWARLYQMAKDLVTGGGPKESFAIDFEMRDGIRLLRSPDTNLARWEPYRRVSDEADSSGNTLELRTE